MQKSTRPYISVNIPVFNGENTLSNCLESVLNQTYKNYEVIVVNNNSTDKTKEIIKEFQGRNKKVKYVFEGCQSIGAARNAGIKIAKGSIIVSTDADCIVPEDWIEKITRPILHENETVVAGFEKDIVKNFWTENIQKMNYLFLKRCHVGKYRAYIDGKNFAIKAKLMKKLMFDPKIHVFEDLDFSIRIKKTTKIRSVPQVKVGHYYKDSFKKVVKMNFIRAFWTTKIYEKYKNNEIGTKNEPMFESISLKNFLMFPVWMALQFIKRPMGEAYFLLISEVAWRAGIIWGKIK